MAEIVKEPWMTDEMFAVWLDYYYESGGTGVTGSEARASTLFRDDARYVEWFPGIKREDGMIRYTGAYPEQQYYNNMAAYRNAIEGVDIDPTKMEAEYVQLIEGDVSPDEFRARVDNLYRRVLSQGDAIRDWYGENFGINLTNAGIIASIMSDDVGNAILEGRMTMAEIGGEATKRNFDITAQFVDMLENEGMNRAEAQQFFGSAERLVPVLGALAARHGDPDDSFDIIEFAEAQVFGDPTQIRRIERLRAQEESTFTGGAQVDYMRDRLGGVAGLTTR